MNTRWNGRPPSAAPRPRPAMPLAFIVAAVLIAGCTSERDRLLQQGYPEPYAAGYGDGCASGRRAGGNMAEQFVKDVPRADTESQYAQGWSDGFDLCKGEQEAFERRMRRQQRETERQTKLPAP